jgi:flavin-dependent dehydrogenase
MNDPDVVILGGGLAGLTLARQLLLESDCRVLVLERQDTVPGPRQKVGESTVQVAGDYFGRVLDLEVYLMHEHFMKYNLRFSWRTKGTAGDRIEDYSQSYIRQYSNIPCYQVDRNRLEAEIARRCSADSRCEIVTSVRDLEVELASDGRHRVAFRSGETTAVIHPAWVVDASGRRRFLARQLGLDRPSPIDHGATFWWVDGIIDMDRLGNETQRQRRLRSSQCQVGHSQQWLATNHFMGHGFWLWLIPLHGKTSVGLVYDPQYVPREQVRTADRAAAWSANRFPMLAPSLLAKPIEEWAGFRSFALDAERVISTDRWALVGEAGRFSDPLYSPGSDQIALHNTAIVGAINSANTTELQQRVGLAEPWLRGMFRAYEPSYAGSYGALGDQETFTLKYTWELAVYFSFYVFPAINDLFFDRRFLTSFLRLFSRLGPINRRVHERIAAFTVWKAEEGRASTTVQYNDFMEVGWLRDAEKTFYRIGVSVEEAREILAERLESLAEMAQWIEAWIDARQGGAVSLAPAGGRWTHDPDVLARLAANELAPAMSVG